MTVARQTQQVIEVLSEVDPTLRASQVILEVLSEVSPACRVSQLIMELITDNVPDDEEDGATQPLLIVVT